MEIHFTLRNSKEKCLPSSTDGEGNQTRCEYNTAGKLAVVVDPRGEREEYHYDMGNRLSQKTDRNGVTVEYGDNLYDAPLYRKARDGSCEEFYEYTSEGLLSSAVSGGMRYAYDGNGNPTRRVADGVEEIYSYDQRNRLVSLTRNGTVSSFQYDHAGNLLRDDKANYEYDAFNRTVKAETFDGNIQVNLYDAEDLRYEMEENGCLVLFIFHREEAISEQEEDQKVIRLVRSFELIARRADYARTYYHYASDEMGSVTHITDEN